MSIHASVKHSMLQSAARAGDWETARKLTSHIMDQEQKAFDLRTKAVHAAASSDISDADRASTIDYCMHESANLMRQGHGWHESTFPPGFVELAQHSHPHLVKEMVERHQRGQKMATGQTREDAEEPAEDDYDEDDAEDYGDLYAGAASRQQPSDG